MYKYNIYLNDELFCEFESILDYDYDVLSSFFHLNQVEADYFDVGDDGELYAMTWQGYYTIKSII